METTLSSEIVERAQPIELVEVEIEAWGAVSGLEELLEALDRYNGDDPLLVVANAVDSDGDDIELERITATADEWSNGVLGAVSRILKLPAAKYRITAWPLVRGEFKGTVFAEGAVAGA
jgi:hypothetical protein